MDFHSKRDVIEDSPPTQRKKPRLGDNPGNDLSDRNVGSEDRSDSESCGMLIPTTPDDILGADSLAQEHPTTGILLPTKLELAPQKIANIDFHSKRDEIEDSLPKKHRLRNNPGNDLSDQNLGSEDRIDPESCGMLISTTADDILDADSLSQEPALSSLEHADPEPSKEVIRSVTNLEHLLNGCYQVQMRVLLYLDRVDFRNMQLAGLGLDISRIIQRKLLIPVPCRNNGAICPRDNKHVTKLQFLTRIGWLPPKKCDNTTATMDEIKPCTGLIWPKDLLPGTTENVDRCRDPHFDITNYEVKGSSHNVCLECVQFAEHHMSPLEHHKISRLRRTLCSKHTRENTPLAQHEPCKCLVILNTEWRCWGCRRSTRRGLTRIALRRREALDKGLNGDDDNHGGDGGDGAGNIEGDEGGEDGSDDDFDEASDGNDSEDRDMKDEKIPRDKAHFCPVSGCQEWIIPPQQAAVKKTGGGLKMCLACQSIILPSVEENKGD